MDAKKTVEEPKVSIEIITDAAMPSEIFACAGGGKRPIVLLGADRVCAADAFVDGKDSG